LMDLQKNYKLFLYSFLFSYMYIVMYYYKYILKIINLNLIIPLYSAKVKCYNIKNSLIFERGQQNV